MRPIAGRFRSPVVISGRDEKSRELTLALSDADALTTTDARGGLARICVLETTALPVKAEVERAAMLTEEEGWFTVCRVLE